MENIRRPDELAIRVVSSFYLLVGAFSFWAAIDVKRFLKVFVFLLDGRKLSPGMEKVVRWWFWVCAISSPLIAGWYYCLPR